MKVRELNWQCWHHRLVILTTDTISPRQYRPYLGYHTKLVTEILNNAHERLHDHSHWYLIAPGYCKDILEIAVIIEYFEMANVKKYLWNIFNFFLHQYLIKTYLIERDNLMSPTIFPTKSLNWETKIYTTQDSITIVVFSKIKAANSWIS